LDIGELEEGGSEFRRSPLEGRHHQLTHALHTRGLAVPGQIAVRWPAANTASTASPTVVRFALASADANNMG